jgi:hypothetical protein
VAFNLRNGQKQFMNNNEHPEGTILNNDYDSPWKEALSHFFKSFMEFFFPEAYEQIDWSRSYELLDTELQRISQDTNFGKRLADKIIKVFLKNPDNPTKITAAIVIIHIEIQGEPDANFTRRMFIYHYRIFEKYVEDGVQISSFAVLSDKHPNWRPNSYTHNCLNCRLTLDYNVVKLLDYKECLDNYEQSKNPFSLIAAAHLKSKLLDSHDPERLESKINLVKAVYRLGYNKEEVRPLFNLIDWLIKLPEELDQKFITEIHKYEQELKMPYINSVERFKINEATQRGVLQGIKQGIEQGVQQGVQQGLLQGQIAGTKESLRTILAAKFKFIPDALNDQIEMITDPNRLSYLLVQAVHVSNLEDFSKALVVQDTSEDVD